MSVYGLVRWQEWHNLRIAGYIRAYVCKYRGVRDMRLNAKYLSNSALCAVFGNEPKIVFL